MANYVYLAQSLDGYIADKNHSVDFLSDFHNEEVGQEFVSFIDQIDAIIMGRKTFDVVHDFGVWPYTKPVYILSQSLKELPKNYEGKAFLWNQDIPALLEYLQSQNHENLYIDGGSVVQYFLKENLVDQLIITTAPIILGDGISLFQPNDQGIKKLKHHKTKALSNGLVINHYCQ